MTHSPIPAAKAIKIMREALNHIALFGDADNTSVIALEATADIEQPQVVEQEPTSAFAYAWKCKAVDDWRIEKLGDGCIAPIGTIALFTHPPKIAEGLKPTDSDFLAEYLRLWEQRGNAPENELRSIQAWLRFLGEHDKETTLDVMRKRMYLLMNKSVEIHEKGESEEDRIGIYQNRSRESFAAAPTPKET